MIDDETIKVFMNRVPDIVNVIHAHGEALDDTSIRKNVLRSLPKKFYPITIIVEESRDLSQQTLV